MKKDNKFLKHLANWLDAFLLLPGMALIAVGVFLIYVPAGFMISGICLVILSYFIAKKQYGGDD